MTFADSNSLSSEYVRAICALISSSMEFGCFPRRASNLLREVDGFSKSQYSLASKLIIGVRALNSSSEKDVDGLADLYAEASWFETAARLIDAERVKVV